VTDTTVPDDILKTGGALDGGVGESIFGDRAEGRLIGRHIGNVRIEEFIGAGGMGEVYLGMDERLDRKVAVKSLKPGLRVSEDVRNRFYREARILSRLDHPSICRLYDLVDSTDPPCLLLEYLDGRPLTELVGDLKEEEILDIAIQTAEALAAAHGEGVIHRDLKPDNIMVMDDGTVKILDFGIGRLIEDIGPEPVLPQEPDRSRVHHGDTPTVHGAIMGTPRYMSPEQAMGEPVTPATDVFSLGIVLFGLFEGRSPYPTEDPLALLAQIPTAEIEAPPSASQALRDLVTLLLDKDPMARPSAAEAAASLKWIREAPKRKRRRIWALAAGCVGVAALIGALVGGRILGEGRYRCKGFERHLDGIWDPGVQEALGYGYRSIGRDSSWQLLQPVLEDYSRQWLTLREDVCQSTWIHREQTPELLDLEIECLDQHLQSMASLLEVLARDPAATVDRAVLGALALPSMEVCLNADLVRSRVPLPENPEVRSRVDAARKAISEARALYDTGEYARGWEVLEPLDQSIRSIDYKPLSALYDYVRGLVLEKRGEIRQAEDILKEALLEAEVGRDDRLAAQAWIRLVWIRGVVLSDGERIEETIEFARAALGRLGDDPELEGALANHEGAIKRDFGDPQGALDLCVEALRLRKVAFGEKHPKVASTLQNCANDMSDLGDLEGALKMAREALEMRIDLLGPSHPSVYISLMGVEQILRGLGRKNEARELLRRAIVIAENAYPPEHPQIGTLKSNLSVQAVRNGEYEEARRLAEEGYSILKASLGLHALATEDALLNLVVACSRLEDWDCVVENGKLGEGCYLHDERARIAMRSMLGGGLLELDRPDEALVVLGPTLDSAEAFLSPGHLLSIVRFRYAIAAVMDDRPRAIAQARRALDELNGIQDSALDEFRHEIEAWLAVQ
jgi:tetratricopeptide (TPR) repeat protein/predicted Ser/Thr protein kinase